MNRLKQKYQQELVSTLQKEFKHKNVFSVVKVEKVAISMGIKDPSDPKARAKVVANVAEQFAVISGQKSKTTTVRSLEELDIIHTDCAAAPHMGGGVWKDPQSTQNSNHETGCDSVTVTN